MRIEDALDNYLRQLEADGRSLHTIGQARRHVALLARWARTVGLSGEIEDLGHEDVARFLAAPEARTRPDGRGKKATSANALRSTVRTFFRYCHEGGYLRANPARLVRLARCAPPPPKGLSESEQARLLEVFAGARTAEERRDRVLFILLLTSGIRVGSAVQLDVEDIDLERAELRLRHAKGDRDEVVVLPRRAVELLRAHLEGMKTGPLFRGRHGERIGARHVRRRLDRWCRKAGIRTVAPHGLRHSFAMRLLRGTSNLVIVKGALHHRSIASTAAYLHADHDELRRALEAH